MRIVNFDNAATTYPKPPEVRQAVDRAVAYYGGNAGRGGHPITARTSEMVFSARETVAAFFGGKVENTIFTMNCTHALNQAIRGVVSPGDHVIISSIEHNSVFRPVAALAKAGIITFSIAQVSADPVETLQAFQQLIRPHTKAIACTIAGNVTGQIMPWKELGELCQSRNICMIADGAQACGILPVSMSDGINILCTAGHKGLYGITGTGVLLTDGAFPLYPLMQGGTGSASASPDQPDFLPDRLESGTLNIIGAASLKAGIEFVQRQPMERLLQKESRLCTVFCSLLESDPAIQLYREPGVSYVPIVSFNALDIPPEELAAALGEQGFCLRAGLHCSPLAHQTLGTPDGTVRFAPSAFSRESDVIRLADAVKKSVRMLKK